LEFIYCAIILVVRSSTQIGISPL